MNGQRVSTGAFRRGTTAMATDTGEGACLFGLDEKAPNGTERRAKSIASGGARFVHSVHELGGVVLDLVTKEMVGIGE